MAFDVPSLIYRSNNSFCSIFRYNPSELVKTGLCVKTPELDLRWCLFTAQHLLTGTRRAQQQKDAINNKDDDIHKREAIQILYKQI